LVRRAFVGREQELGLLEGYLDDALEGRPTVVLCRGEPGIGKTRLAEELTGIARERDMLAVWGLGVDAEGAPPYWPWRQILRAVAESVDLTSLAEDHNLTADLARLAPDQFVRREDVAGSTEDRFRQFDAVAQLLRQVVLRQPLVIVLDDAHWADRPSVLLLQHLARTLRDEPLLVVANHRDTEHDHAALFAELVREPVTREIDLTGLNATAVAMQLASVVGRDVDPGDAEQVRALTGGNPFFVGEVGRVLPAGKVAGALAPVTANVREAIRSRLNRLSPECVDLLHAASIVGREFSTTVVAPMINTTLMTCVSLLDEAATAGLVEDGTAPGEHRFAHALVRDAIEAGLPGGERVRLHRAAADAIERVYSNSLERHLSDLARHWAVAAADGERATAAQWIELAADGAMRTLAYEEGARLFHLALTIGDVELDALTRCRLLLSEARALNASVDIAGCIEACVQAATLARGIGRADLLAKAALVRDAIGPTLSEATTRRLCDEALEDVDPLDIALRTRLLARRAEASIYVAWLAAYGTDDYDMAEAASNEALALAERSGDRAALEAALRARRLSRSGPEGLEERAHLADRMLELGRETADPHTQMWAHLWHIDAAFGRGELTRVAREIEELALCAEQVRGPHARYELAKCRAVLAQAQARFGDAMRLAEEAFGQLVTTGDFVGFHERAGLLHQIGLHIGHEASGSLEASGYADVTVFEQELQTAGVIIAVANAHMLASLGRVDEGAAVYRSLGPPSNWHPSPHAILPAFAFGINLGIALGADDDVAVLRERLGEYRGHHVVSGAGQVAYFGPVELWLGRAAARLGRLDDAVGDLEIAANACAANGAAGYEVEAQYELAAVLIRRRQTGDVGRARNLLATVTRRASELGMAPFKTEAGALIESLVAAGPLSRREWEVAGLIAKGMTNREIAETLYLSERTAQNHVQHVLTKLGLSNRSQIATWVARQEMSTPTE
jgi:DNA-binding CsgD family transcriptional regulator